MNKDTLLEEVRKVELALNLAEQSVDIDHSLLDDVWHLIDCINKLDEPTKPVVPQFVADYIEKWKERRLLLTAWLDFNYVDDFENKTEEWLYSGNYEENITREYLLIGAIRYGYEVEKEQKKEKNYEVIVGTGRSGVYRTVVVLYKSVGGTMVLKEMTVADYEDSKQRVPTSFWLTEKQIKDYDKRYWVFAEEVTG